MELPDGLYDQLLTEALWEVVSQTTGENGRTLKPLKVEEAPERLANALASQLIRILDDLSGDGPETLKRQLELINAILIDTRQRVGRNQDGIDAVTSPPQLLQAIHAHSSTPVLPETGLAMPWLFTAGKGSPSLLSELRRELAACDGVDILVSFITHSGVRKLLDVLQSVTSIDADGLARTRMRVLTTTYTGATEIQALDELACLPGCEIRVSLDGRRTRGLSVMIVKGISTPAALLDVRHVDVNVRPVLICVDGNMRGYVTLECHRCRPAISPQPLCQGYWTVLTQSDSNIATPRARPALAIGVRSPGAPW
jgi:hypothetical protein